MTHPQLGKAKNRGEGVVNVCARSPCMADPKRPAQRRQGPSFRPPPQVHGLVCREPWDCLVRRLR